MIQPYLRYLFLGLAAMIVFAVVVAQAAVVQPQMFAYPRVATGEALNGETQAKEYEGSHASDAISHAYLTDTFLLQSGVSNAVNNSAKASIDHIFPGVGQSQAIQLLSATTTDMAINKVVSPTPVIHGEQLT